jgi:hypothetical protein
MRIPNADFLERTGSENLGARLWRLPLDTVHSDALPRFESVGQSCRFAQSQNLHRCFV